MSGIKEIWIVRHGVTQWSKTGQHTSFSDPDLLPEGIKKLQIWTGFLRVSLLIWSIQAHPFDPDTLPKF